MSLKSNKIATPITFSLLLDFFHLCEKLKCILRHGWTSTGKQESVAEHSWRLSIMLITIAPYLDRKVKILKALKMAIIHDLVEVYAGDVPYFLAPEGSQAKAEKEKREHQAMDKINQILPLDLGNELSALWQEYNRGKSYEAKVVKALDKIEAQLQLNEKSPANWLDCEIEDATRGRTKKYCEFDSFISQINNFVISESRDLVSKYFDKDIIEQSSQ